MFKCGLDLAKIEGLEPAFQRCRKEYSPQVPRGTAEVRLGTLEDSKFELEDFQTTPLAVAAQSGHLEVMVQSLDFGATIYDPPRFPNALAKACRGAKPKDTVELLLGILKEPSALTAACDEALASTARERRDEAFETIARQLPLSSEILQKACMLGSVDAVGWVLEQGVEADSDFPDGGRALHVATYYGDSDVVSLLIKEGADCTYVSAKFGSPLQSALEGLLARAVGSEASEFREILPEALPSSNPISGLSFLETPQGRYKKDAAEEIVRTLAREGAKADTEARVFGTPLHIASCFGGSGTDPVTSRQWRRARTYWWLGCVTYHGCCIRRPARDGELHPQPRRQRQYQGGKIRKRASLRLRTQEQTYDSDLG